MKIYSDLNDRNIWINILSRIAEPILVNIDNNTLKKNMVVDYVDETRMKFAYLEAVGRLICGISSWLALGADNTSEGKLREKYINLIVGGLSNICNPDSDDYLIFEGYPQPLVDTAFLAQGILRAKSQLWDNIDEIDKQLILNAFMKTRSIKPYNSNWLLFASMIETFFLETTGTCDMIRLMEGVNAFKNDWYCGDGHYSDGDVYHFDYYNSFVIHPMLTDILIILNKHNLCDECTLNTQLNRLKQYASHLEKLISPEGTFPIFGRSMAYRTGVFHALGEACLLNLYVGDIVPEQVRAALTKVIKRQLCNDDNFDGNWLKIGFNGNQKRIAERYINTGSLYLCSTVFLPLGLSETDRFWTAPSCEWSSVKGWNGRNIDALQSINDINLKNHNGNLIKYNTARIDFKNYGTENNMIKIINISDIFASIDYPNWFKDNSGSGCVIQSQKNHIDIEFQCIGDGDLKVILRGIDARDINNNRIPIYINYNNLIINNKLLFTNKKLVCHDKTHEERFSVVDGQLFNFHIEWNPF